MPVKEEKEHHDVGLDRLRDVHVVPSGSPVCQRSPARHRQHIPVAMFVAPIKRAAVLAHFSASVKRHFLPNKTIIL